MAQEPSRPKLPGGRRSHIRQLANRGEQCCVPRDAVEVVPNRIHKPHPSTEQLISRLQSLCVRLTHLLLFRLLCRLCHLPCSLLRRLLGSLPCCLIPTPCCRCCVCRLLLSLRCCACRLRCLLSCLSRCLSCCDRCRSHLSHLPLHILPCSSSVLPLPLLPLPTTLPREHVLKSVRILHGCQSSWTHHRACAGGGCSRRARPTPSPLLPLCRRHRPGDGRHTRH